MHDLQKKILKVLLLNEKARFSEMNVENITNDHFSFHVKRLLKLGHVLKDEKGFYHLTNKGKEYANRFDVDGERIELEKQAKIGVLVVCVKGKGDKKKYLIQKRLKHPYYGYHGFITGKVKWGEKIFEAAGRELEEEAGLRGSLRLAGVEHKMDFSKKGKLLEDKYFYVVEASELKGKLKKEFEAGENIWFSEREIKEIGELFGDVLFVLKMVEEKEFSFLEKRYEVDRY